MRDNKIPKEISDKYGELIDIINKYPNAISLTACAKYLHMDPESLRTSIEQGKCKFGMSWKSPGGVNRAYLIPTLQFYLWITNQNGMTQ